MIDWIMITSTCRGCSSCILFVVECINIGDIYGKFSDNDYTSVARDRVALAKHMNESDEDKIQGFFIGPQDE